MDRDKPRLSALRWCSLLFLEPAGGPAVCSIPAFFLSWEHTMAVSGSALGSAFLAGKTAGLTNYPELSGRIESIVEGDDGAVWLVRTQATDITGPLCADVEGRGISVLWRKRRNSLRLLRSRLSRDSSGELWVGGYSELLSLEGGNVPTAYFAKPSQRPETLASLQRDRSQEAVGFGLGCH